MMPGEDEAIKTVAVWSVWFVATVGMLTCVCSETAEVSAEIVATVAVGFCADSESFGVEIDAEFIWFCNTANFCDISETLTEMSSKLFVEVETGATAKGNATSAVERPETLAYVLPSGFCSCKLMAFIPVTSSAKITFCPTGMSVSLGNVKVLFGETIVQPSKFISVPEL